MVSDTILLDGVFSDWYDFDYIQDARTQYRGGRENTKCNNEQFHGLICKKCVVLPVNGSKNIAVEQCEVWGKERSGLVVHL